MNECFGWVATQNIAAPDTPNTRTCGPKSVLVLPVRSIHGQAEIFLPLGKCLLTALCQPYVAGVLCPGAEVDHSKADAIHILAER